jgi:4-hydroxyproline epimerase
LVGVTAVLRHRRDRVPGLAQQAHRDLHPGFLNQLPNRQLKDFSHALLELIFGKPGPRRQILDPHRLMTVRLNKLNCLRNLRIVFALFVSGLEVFGYADEADHAALAILQGQLVCQAPAATAGMVEMQFELIQHCVATVQYPLILSPIRLAQRRRKNLIRAASQQLVFLAPAATFHERLVHHHIFVARIFDEEHQVGETIEQRLANERFRQLREQLRLQVSWFHGRMRCAEILVATGQSDKTRLRARLPSLAYHMKPNLQRLTVIDSHTGGEPTRIVVSGGPDLGSGSITARRERLQREFDHYRSAVVNEPRGSDVVVGALLVEPEDKSCATGVIFFNNVGYLGMCGHGTIGLIVTLAHLGKITAGDHRIETPVGIVTATLHPNGEVSVANIPSWRAKKAVTVNVPGIGEVIGDLAWGGNWFFLIEKHGQELALANVEKLTDYCWRVRQAVNAQGFPEVDHVELFGPPSTPEANSRNFVQCPGKAYDRSPCGTGTSAKLACLAADGKLAEGAPWIQESIIGSKFTGRFQWLNQAEGKVSPIITGTAFVNAEITQVLDERDPFCWGIR